MKVVYVEMTPNPNALKFHVDGRLIPTGSRSFDSPDEAQADPLARTLFAAGPITSVFVMPNFVTLSKTPEGDWFTMRPAINQALEEARSVEPAAAPEASAAPEGDPARLARINEVLDSMIRPALASDGGGLEVLGLAGNELRIRYQGACGSCPSSIAGTLGAIQNMLRVEVDRELTVVPA